MTASFSLDIHLAPGHCGHKRIRKGRKPEHAKPTRLPRITRLMALAIKYEDLIDSGVVEGHDALARLAGVDRSQVSRIMRLRLLGPKIQENLLGLQEVEAGRDTITWKDIDPITRISSWEKQRELFNRTILKHT